MVRAIIVRSPGNQTVVANPNGIPGKGVLPTAQRRAASHSKAVGIEVNADYSAIAVRSRRRHRNVRRRNKLRPTRRTGEAYRWWRISP